MKKTSNKSKVTKCVLCNSNSDNLFVGIGGNFICDSCAKDVSNEYANRQIEENPERSLVITKTIENTENYTFFSEYHPTMKQIKQGLEDASLNLVQHATQEPLVLVIDSDGKMVAVLEKDGGDNSEHCEVKIQ